MARSMPRVQQDRRRDIINAKKEERAKRAREKMLARQRKNAGRS